MIFEFVKNKKYKKNKKIKIKNNNNNNKRDQDCSQSSDGRGLYHLRLKATMCLQKSRKRIESCR